MFSQAVSKVAPTRNVLAPAGRPAAKPSARSDTNGSSGGVAAVNHQVEELSAQVMDMKLNVEGLEKERDFYFSKLRDIEIMCQEVDGADVQPLVQKILDVLYQTEVSRMGSVRGFGFVAGSPCANRLTLFAPTIDAGWFRAARRSAGRRGRVLKMCAAAAVA